MQYIQITESSASFKLNDLIKKVGVDEAGAFLRAYRHACTAEENGIVIKCYNLGELLNRFFADDYAEEERGA